MMQFSFHSNMADIVRRNRRIQYINNILPFDRRIFRDRSNPLETLEPSEIRERYRFYPETILFLCQSLQLERKTARSNPLPPLLCVLVALHFCATNAHHIVTADLHGVSRASVSRAVRLFCNLMAIRVREFVPFPTGDAVRQVQRKFFSIAGFPNVVGAVDGTQIRIRSPRQHEGDYINRKGYHSLNVQMICDSSFRFTDVVAKWPGSVHDSRMWRESSVSERFERGEIDGILLGDSGYACKKYLLTPYLAPQTPAQERYNAALCRTRVLVEQSYGIVKRRFPCLTYGLRTEPKECVQIILACVGLHNVGLDRGDIMERFSVDIVEEPIEVDAYVGPQNGAHYRDYFANAYFG